ncbi:hypothetical protein NKG05_13770 [Oerskovia sp. M15]
MHDLVLAAWARATITYDPNARPSLMGTAEAALTRIEPLVAAADVVKVSDEDVAWLYPAPTPSRSRGSGPRRAQRSWS